MKCDYSDIRAMKIRLKRAFTEGAGSIMSIRQYKEDISQCLYFLKKVMPSASVRIGNVRGQGFEIRYPKG